MADRRLVGKRSRRVEALCRAHDGKGSPCDFISIHSYNRSEMMAAKLIKAKKIALEIDPEYYAHLWVNSHESCPDWMPPPDEAASDSYLGNGYFPTWCVDVVHRQLARAARDPRYAYGETILTVWPPPINFAGLNAVTRVIGCDDNGDGRSDREVTVPMPIFHVLGLLSDLGDRYWVLPDQTAGGHKVTGFASRDDGGIVRVLLYAHDPRDTQSRSGATFDIALELSGLGGSSPITVQEYRFDRDHNSPFRLARALRDRPGPSGGTAFAPAEYSRRGRGGPSALRVPADEHGHTPARGRRPPPAVSEAGGQRLHFPDHRVRLIRRSHHGPTRPRSFACHGDEGRVLEGFRVPNPGRRPRGGPTDEMRSTANPWGIRRVRA